MLISIGFQLLCFSQNSMQWCGTFWRKMLGARATFAEPCANKKRALQDICAMRARWLQQLPKNRADEKKHLFMIKRDLPSGFHSSCLDHRGSVCMYVCIYVCMCFFFGNQKIVQFLFVLQICVPNLQNTCQYMFFIGKVFQFFKMPAYIFFLSGMCPNTRI